MSTMFGELLTRLQKQRKVSRMEAERDIWKRNKLNPNAEGYRLAETKMVQSDGTEVVELRLYKLIDCSVIKVGADVRHEIEIGINSIAKGRR